MSIIRVLLLTVVGYLRADWKFLLLGILLAVGINVYLDPARFRAWMERKAGTSILSSIAFGAFTPLCACGTMAVLLSMFMSALPWGPVMAFLISSPLTSPSEYVFETAFLGSSFANAMVVSSLLLGLVSGYMAYLLSRHTHFFDGQLVIRRVYASQDEAAASRQPCCGANQETPAVTPTCSCSGVPVHTTWSQRLKLKEFVKSFIDLGLKKVLLYFAIFIAVGKIAEMLIPASWVIGLFGAGQKYSIPLAATLGLPLYVSGSSALPLVKSFVESGAGQGAILAFMIAGKATGIPVIAGLSTIIKRRALLFYVIVVYLGAILAGYTFQLFA